MKANWPKLPLGEVLRQRVPDVSVDPTNTYAFAGVYSFGRGVFRTHVRPGSEFAYQRLTRLHAGEFVYPKLMAWEGAFGIVPIECDGCYVSPEFPAFEIDAERLAPTFLGFYFQIPRVWESVSGGSTGTNVRRRRLHPEDFLRREIPLPPLEEQRRVAVASKNWPPRSTTPAPFATRRPRRQRRCSARKPRGCPPRLQNISP